MKSATIFAFGAFYALVVNSYFGYNWYPQSPEELIADGLFTLIMAVGVLAYSPHWRTP
jgi:hypothetical protein